MKNQSKAYFFAILTVISWSTIASCFKITLRYLSNVEVVLYATFFSLLVLAIVLAYRGKLVETLKSPWKDYKKSAWLGFLNPFLYYFILIKAYELLPAQEAQPINMIWPIVLVIMSIPILGQRPPWQSHIGFIISFAGVFVIATRGDIFSFQFSDPWGVALATGSSVIWAMYWLGTMKYEKEEISKLFLNFLFGLVYCLVAAIAMGEIRMPPWEGIAGAAWAGLFEMGLCFVFWLKALQYSTSADRVAILVYIVPFTSMMLVGLIVGESIQVSSVLGAVFIISGILIQKYLSKRLQVKEAE